MKYIIGIDLGTTNCCVSFIDSSQNNLSIQPFHIPQLSSAGLVESKSTLPSFCYLATPSEWAQDALNLPWSKRSDYFVGSFAQEQGAKTPTRLVRSAKSWLCHAAANRRDKILPIEASDENQRISPVETAARYLLHIKEAWNFQIAAKDPEALFEEQEVIITVPASFDEVSRMLTIEAAKRAGFIKMTLLEEPQAAFYSWISYHETALISQLKPGEIILVCDVGGGTTDFSLIEVISKDGKIGMQRMAVGDHLLLGGDNMDNTLAHELEKLMGISELPTAQWLQLCHQARIAKERLLAPNTSDTNCKIVLQGTGSNIVRGSTSIEISRKQMEDILLNGFFGEYTWEEATQLKKAKGLRTMGLPYEDEPSITKHLAAFLEKSAPKKGFPQQPDYILFNGGTMKAPLFQKAIVNSLKNWFPKKQLQVLASSNLDLAVARGATYFGKVRRGLGIKIEGGSSRGYYLSVEVKGKETNASQVLTVLPRGSREGDFYESPKLFWIMPNTPVAFTLYSSHVRLHDSHGDLLPIDSNEMHPLPPIHTILRFGKQDTSKDPVPVRLKIGLTEVGTLELMLQSEKTTHQWALEFQLRNASGQENSMAVLNEKISDETWSKNDLDNAKCSLIDLFNGTSSVRPGQIMEHLESILGQPRKDWHLSRLRGLCDAIIQVASKRKRSSEHEARWWNLVGFFLRPGYGFPLDDFRMKEVWKIILEDLKHQKSMDCQIQSWICYRRISGGLNRGQQAQLASFIPIFKSEKIEIKNKSDLYQYSEKIRTLGAFELIEVPLKIKLGNALILRMISEQSNAADFWALGRLGARQLIYGTPANVVPKNVVEEWLRTLLKHHQQNEHYLFAIGQLARRTDQRELNISIQLENTILEKFATHDRLKTLILNEGQLTAAEQEQLYGDRLPAGLLIEQ